MVTKTLQDLIRLRRKKITQSALAKKLDMSRQQVNNIESGRQGHPSIKTIEKYAKAIDAVIVVEDSDE